MQAALRATGAEEHLGASLERVRECAVRARVSQLESAAVGGAFRAWRHSCRSGERRRRLVHRVVGKLMRRGVQSAFVCWRAYSQSQARMRLQLQHEEAETRMQSAGTALEQKNAELASHMQRELGTAVARSEEQAREAADARRRLEHALRDAEASLAQRELDAQSERRRAEAAEEQVRARVAETELDAERRLTEALRQSRQSLVASEEEAAAANKRVRVLEGHIEDCGAELIELQSRLVRQNFLCEDKHSFSHLQFYFT